MPSALLKPTYSNVIRYLGDAGVPQDMLRRRRLSLETMRRMGTPVLIKRRFTVRDVEEGVAVSSVGRDSIYGQAIHDDPFSYGTGFVSKETQPGEWVVPPTEREGAKLVIAETPEEGWLPAPKYRCYGPGFLTYAILPDAPEDVFKLTESGALIRQQQARFQLPWNPQVGDNDLLVVCELGSVDPENRSEHGETIINTFERYQLKQVAPITMRGHDRLGRRELSDSKQTAAGNRFIVGQQCEGNKVPEFDPIYEVEVDR